MLLLLLPPLMWALAPRWELPWLLDNSSRAMHYHLLVVCCCGSCCWGHWEGVVW